MTSQNALQVPGFEHRSARNGDVEIHYVVAGEGDPVILLHGFPETWFGWRELIPQLAATHRIIAPDLRGLGESSRPPAGYEKKTIATDIEAVIRTEGLSNYHLVGADMGAAVAFPLAMASGEKVRSFVFIASGLPGVGLGDWCQTPLPRPGETESQKRPSESPSTALPRTPRRIWFPKTRTLNGLIETTRKTPVS